MSHFDPKRGRYWSRLSTFMQNVKRSGELEIGELNCPRAKGTAPTSVLSLADCCRWTTRASSRDVLVCAPAPHRGGTTRSAHFAACLSPVPHRDRRVPVIGIVSGWPTRRCFPTVQPSLRPVPAFWLRSAEAEWHAGFVVGGCIPTLWTQFQWARAGGHRGSYILCIP